MSRLRYCITSTYTTAYPAATPNPMTTKAGVTKTPMAKLPATWWGVCRSAKAASSFERTRRRYRDTRPMGFENERR